LNGGVKPLQRAYSLTHTQVQGSKALPQLAARLRREGIPSLYQGAVIQAVATAAGHWPYFLIFNYLSSIIPVPPSGEIFPRLGRNAFLGNFVVCQRWSFRVNTTSRRLDQIQFVLTFDSCTVCV
jgi:hypothetical protein